MSKSPFYIKPTWPAPPTVLAYTSTRFCEGYSQAPYADFNLAGYVGDDPEAVENNRKKLKTDLNLTKEPCWLNQVHGTQIVTLTEAYPLIPLPTADASYTTVVEQTCAVLTADCLPILITNQQGTEVAAVHAGWRGLVNGVLQNILALMMAEPKDILVWLAPAIGPTAFEVGEEVKAIYLKKDPCYETAFVPQNHKWAANLYEIARIILAQHGITQVFGGDYCTYHDQNLFSYRRDTLTGRMASLIWMKAPQAS